MEKKLSGAELIAQERQRQIDVEGWTIQHDLAHDDEALAYAAAAYALPDELRTEWQKKQLYHRSNLFPFEKRWWKPSLDNRIKELVKSGALIAAEIDRLQEEDRLQSLTLNA